jgi:hypothetical protein
MRLCITVQDTHWEKFSVSLDLNFSARDLRNQGRGGHSDHSMHRLSRNVKYRHTHEQFSLKLSSYPASFHQTPSCTVFLQISLTQIIRSISFCCCFSW